MKNPTVDELGTLAGSGIGPILKVVRDAASRAMCAGRSSIAHASLRSVY